MRAGQGCDVRSDRADGGAVRLYRHHERVGEYLFSERLFDLSFNLMIRAIIGVPLHHGRLDHLHGKRSVSGAGASRASSCVKGCLTGTTLAFDFCHQHVFVIDTGTVNRKQGQTVYLKQQHIANGLFRSSITLSACQWSWSL